MLNDSENLVVDGSDPKSDPNLSTHTINGISFIDTTNKILEQRLYPLFIKPAIQAVKTRSRESCRIPIFIRLGGVFPCMDVIFEYAMFFEDDEVKVDFWISVISAPSAIA